jgi:hypothetical protein
LDCRLHRVVVEVVQIHPRPSTSSLQAVKFFFGEFCSDTN